MKKFNLLILAVLVLGIILRFAWLGQYPLGFFRDEAALGYNAYSIWETGKDEYGINFPTVFRSFEVFFLPAYVYLTAPIVGLFGLSEFTTRILSALSGTFALILIYFLALQIWNSRKAAFFALLVLTISPWHIFYSRGAFEGNLALTFFTGGFLFWLKFLEKSRIQWFLISAILFALSMYSYQAERLVVFFFVIAAITISSKKLWALKQKLIIPSILVLFLLTPLLSLSLTPGGYHRGIGVTYFSKNEPLTLHQAVSLYFSYYSPRNLFFEGDYFKQRSIQNYSVFYAWMFPFLIIGLVVLIKEKTDSKKLLLSWILLAPIPAALTTDPFHTYRSLLLYLPLSLLIAKGISALPIKYHFITAVFFLISLSYFLYSYFILNPVVRARDWEYGYKEIISFLNSQSDYDRIIINDPSSESYIHYLFFNKVDPRIYHKEVAKLGTPENYYYMSAAELRPNRLSNYYFRPVDWPTERGDTGTIFVMAAQELYESEFKNDPEIKLLKEIFYPDGSPAFRIVKAINPPSEQAE